MARASPPPAVRPGVEARATTEAGVAHLVVQVERPAHPAVPAPEQLDQGPGHRVYQGIQQTRLPAPVLVDDPLYLLHVPQPPSPKDKSLTASNHAVSLRQAGGGNNYT